MKTPQTQRVDIYRGIHKGVRAYMFDTLNQVSSLDLDDEREVSAVMAQARGLAAFCADHLRHEDEFVHTAMEARQPGSASATSDDHIHHLESVRKINHLADVIAQIEPEEKPAALSGLQQYLELFIAESLEHMHYEETHNNRILWAHYSDDELMGIEQSIVASLSPEEFSACMCWMLIGFNPSERAELLNNIRIHAPAPVFDMVLEIARSRLQPFDVKKLEKTLGLDTRLAA